MAGSVSAVSGIAGCPELRRVRIVQARAQRLSQDVSQGVSLVVGRSWLRVACGLFAGGKVDRLRADSGHVVAEGSQILA